MREILYTTIYSLALFLDNKVGLAILVAAVLLQLGDKTDRVRS